MKISITGKELLVPFYLKIFFMKRKIKLPDGKQIVFHIKGKDNFKFLLPYNYKDGRLLVDELKRQKIVCYLNFAGGIGWYIKLAKDSFKKIKNLCWT